MTLLGQVESGWTIIFTAPVGEGPADIAISPDGSTAYVVNSASNNVTAIDTSYL